MLNPIPNTNSKNPNKNTKNEISEGPKGLLNTNIANNKLLTNTRANIASRSNKNINEYRNRMINLKTTKRLFLGFSVGTPPIRSSSKGETYQVRIKGN